MLVAGNTAQGISRIPDNIYMFIDITPIQELYVVEQTADSLTLGGSVSISETIEAMRAASNLVGFEYFQHLVDHLELVANVPVRNVSDFIVLFVK